MTQTMVERFSVLQEADYRDMTASILGTLSVHGGNITPGEIREEALANYREAYPDDTRAACRYEFIYGALQLNGEID